MIDSSNVLLRSPKPRRRERMVSRGKILGLSGRNTIELVQQVKKGFPYKALDRFHKESGLPMKTITDLIRLPQRTLMRRKAEGRLQPDESERMLRLSTLFEQTVVLFENDVVAARRWLITPSKEFGNVSPVVFAGTEVGAREVEDLIGRLEHGVFT